MEGPVALPSLLRHDLVGLLEHSLPRTSCSHQSALGPDKETSLQKTPTLPNHNGTQVGQANFDFSDFSSHKGIGLTIYFLS